jgi:hypothetical protein
MMDQLGPEIARNLTKMRDLAVAATHIEKAAAIQFGSCGGLLQNLHIRTETDFPVLSLLCLPSHLPPACSLIVTRFKRAQTGPYLT